MQLVKYAFAFETLLKCLFHIPELAVLILTAKSGVLVLLWSLFDFRIILCLPMRNLSLF